MFVSVYTVLSFFLLVFGLLAFGMAGNCECILNAIIEIKVLDDVFPSWGHLSHFKGKVSTELKKTNKP